jgi:hypothetical protein
MGVSLPFFLALSAILFIAPGPSSTDCCCSLHEQCLWLDPQVFVMRSA